MSKKDYELIASVVATIMDAETRWSIADAFAITLRRDNPAFNIATFIKACKASKEKGLLPK